MLAVTDTGIGMDAATRERIFEPFFTTKGEGRGTGLGLATVQAIVTDSQGKITVESEPGRGALFRVYLPVAEGELGAELQPPSIDVEGAPHGAGRRVLLVEDEEAMREVMVRVLTDGGYEVLDARDGEEALTLARASGGPLHVLCTDGILPGLRTDALIAQFRELYPQARVLVCSGHLQEDLVRRRIAEGECAFVQKPFSADELLRAVGELAPPEVEYTP
jgi:CheY-like chemotaxis protein